MVDHYIYDLEDTWNDAGTTFFAISMDVTNTASAAGSMIQRWRVNGSTVASMSPTGVLEVSGWRLSGPGESYFTGGHFYAYYSIGFGTGVGGLCIANGNRLSFQTDGGNPVGAGTKDVAIERSAAGIVEVNNNTKGTLADILARTFKNTPVAFGSLPSAATVGSGARAFINDALTPTFGATAVGGGAIASPVYSDGTTWKIG